MKRKDSAAAPPSTRVTPFQSWVRRGAQPLADLVLPHLDPVLARQGFSEADILLHWPEIVGAKLADHCRPLKLQWRARTSRETNARGEPATLVLRVEGAFAVMLQHMAPVIVEKVNGHLGWACVGKIALKQGPLPQLAGTRTRIAAPDPAARQRAVQSVGPVADDGLRTALVRLGSRVLRREDARTKPS